MVYLLSGNLTALFHPYSLVQGDPNATVDLSWALQIPQYTLVGISDMLVTISRTHHVYGAQSGQQPR